MPKQEVGGEGGFPDRGGVAGEAQGAVAGEAQGAVAGEARGAVAEADCLKSNTSVPSIDLARSFKLAVDSMQIGVTITDLDGRIMYVNEAEAVLHGWEAEELVGQPASILGVPGQAGVASSNSNRVLQRWRRHSINRRKDGTPFPVELLSDLVRDEQGGVAGIVTCCREFSDSMAAAETARKLQRAIDQSPVVVIMTDKDGSIEYVNPQFTVTTGYTVDEVVGKNPRVLKSGLMDPAVYRRLWETISSGETWRGELLNRRKDGSVYWGSAAISGLFDDRGDLRHFVGVQEDITARKEMESQLHESNAELERLNRLKSEMIAVTSHDLRSPLSAMINFADLLKEYSGSLTVDEVARRADQIAAAGRKLADFITDILDVEKIETGKFSLNLASVSLPQVLAGCVEIARVQAAAKRIRIEFYAADGVPPMLADGPRIERIVGNLLTNAVKFSPPESLVTVELSFTGGVATIVVSDQGPGVPEADLENIFGRYFQVSKQAPSNERTFGIGLGLFIVRQLVQLHAGSIRAENRPEGGCRFTVTLPSTVLPRSMSEMRVLVLGSPGPLNDLLTSSVRDSRASVVQGLVSEAVHLTEVHRPMVIFAPWMQGADRVIQALKARPWAPGRAPKLVCIRPDVKLPRAPDVDVSLVEPITATEVLEVLRATTIEIVGEVQES